MTKIRDNRLLWFDIETSDSNENLPHSVLLEVGITITDSSGRLISEKSFVDELTRYQREHISEWPREVMEMHVKNGLLFEVLQLQDTDNLDSRVNAWLDVTREAPNFPRKDYNEALDGPPLEKEELLILAGSGVSHFDRRWARWHLPNFNKRLTHYAIDVGVFRRMLQMHAPQSYQQAIALAGRNRGPKTHRALDCNRDSIAQYVVYMGLIEDIEQHTLDQIRRTVEAGSVVNQTSQNMRPLCSYIGPGDTCTFEPNHRGNHSWE